VTLVAPHDTIVQGQPARIWRGGSGDPLVLLHGGFGDAEQHWRANFEFFARHFTLLAPDLPGFGVSEPIPQPSFTAYLDWLRALLESERFIDRVRVMGNSFGAALARLYAAAHPDEVTRLILVDGGAIPDVPGCLHPLFKLPGLSGFAFERIRRRAYSPDDLKRAILDDAHLTPEYIANAQQASFGFVAALRGIAATPPPTLRTPTCPTLVVWGEADQVLAPSAGRPIAESIPGAHFHLIKKAAHMPQLEQPAVFNEVVLKFLTNDERPLRVTTDD
jgi:2-hydroxy-6-oxonona-2,4-dienedioate hydrolase